MRPLDILPWPAAAAMTLMRGGSRGILGTVTVISLVGIAVGVATLTGVLAVTTGFQDAVRDHILGVYPHMIVMKGGGPYRDYNRDAKRVLKVPGVLEVIPSTYDEMIASSGKGTAGVTVKGIRMDHAMEARLQGLIRQGGMAGFGYKKGAEKQGVVTGCTLAKTLGLHPGDTIGLTTPIRGLGIAGSGPVGMAPMEKRFIYRGCLHTGFYEYDSRLVLMDLKSAQAFLNRGDTVRWLEIRVRDMFNTQEYMKKIQGVLHVFGTPDLVYAAGRMEQELRVDLRSIIKHDGPARTVPDLVALAGNIQRDLSFSALGNVDYTPYHILDWRELNANLFQALRLQKSVMVLFFLVIVIVVAFYVVGTQMMILREKAREIAILNTIGAGGRGVFKVFFWHGLILGTMGSFLGLLAGMGIVWGIGKYRFALDPSVYMINTLPARMDALDAVAIAAITLFVLTATCTISAYKASRADPVQGLRRVV